MRKMDVTKEAFNTKQVCQITGVTPRKVRYWDHKGLVKPSMAPASGRGSRRLYSYTDLLALQTVKQFREEKLPLQRIRKCVRYLRKNLPDISQPLTVCTLIANGETILLVTDEQNLIDTVRRPGQHVLSLRLDIAGLDRELRNRVTQLSAKRVEEVSVGDYAYQVEIEADQECGGYVAEVAGLPGCITDGDTLEETLEMARDAIACWLEAHEEMEQRGIDVPMDKRRRKKRKATA